MTQRQMIIYGVAGLLGLILLVNTFYIVYPTQYALVTVFGAPVSVVKNPGLKMKVPFVQMVEFFDSRILEYRMPQPMEINASDQKRIVVGAYLKWQITDPLKFAQTTRGGTGNRVAVMNDRLATILEASLRQALGGYPLNALLSPKRAQIMQEIRTYVNRQAASSKATKRPKASSVDDDGYGIKIVDVRIIHADLPKENSDAIFRRMIAERQREAKQFRAEGEEEALGIRGKADKERTIIMAEAQKKSETIRGEGDAEASKIFAAAFNKDPKFFDFYRSMQAYSRSINSKDTTVILSPDSKFLKQMENAE